MAVKIGGSGGFVALNKGKIKDCYSTVKTYANNKSGGFCGINTGSIKKCYSRGFVKKHGNNPRFGFCAKQNGKMEDSFWIYNEKCKDEKECHKRFQEYNDRDIGIDKYTFKEELKDKINNWNVEETWNVYESEGDINLRLYNQEPTLEKRRKVVEINNKEDLLEAVENINNLTSNENIMYRLNKDIDLKGMKWTPAGIDQNTPFSGCFDGAGHVIKNFAVQTEKTTYAGFFGFIGEKGEVHNLTIDCVVRGKGDYAAPLCGWNEGTISDCITRSVGHSSRYSGGFAGHNGGTILRCCAHGKLKMPLIIPWWLPAAGLTTVIVATPPIMGVQSYLNSQNQMFAPVITDPNAKPIEKDKDIIPAPVTPEGEKDTSTAFIMNADMDVSQQNYVGSMGLKCPPWSTKGFVATAYVSSGDLSANGASYTKDAVVYTSGLIGPGMGVDVVTLSALPDGSKLPKGHYTLTVQFDFYDMETNECAAVNTTAPIDINIF